jgi:HD-like signal output (HDOD) protein
MLADSAKILIVVDDPVLRKTLQQLLLNESWDCRFAGSGDTALEMLNTEPFELIVADQALNQSGGIELLHKVRQHHPQTTRLLLAEQTQVNSSVEFLATGCAQQVLPRPWIDQEFKEIIRSALRQSALQKQYSPEFQALINSIPLLPTLPESYSRVRSCIVGDEVDIEKMAATINQDVSMTSILLHWANSALFGQRFQVDTTKKAIIVLGTDIVENLILSEAISRTIAANTTAIKGFELQLFKKHSIATAVIARLLIKTLYHSDKDRQDRAFIAGLLHDMGILAAASFFPQQFEQAIEIAQNRPTSLIEAEHQTYASSHAEIGAFLAEWWSLPPLLVNAIAWHHQPRSTPVDEEIVVATCLANRLSCQFNYGGGFETVTQDIPEDYRKLFFLNDEATEILQNECNKTILTLLH